MQIMYFFIYYIALIVKKLSWVTKQIPNAIIKFNKNKLLLAVYSVFRDSDSGVAYDN